MPLAQTESSAAGPDRSRRVLAWLERIFSNLTGNSGGAVRYLTGRFHRQSVPSSDTN